MAQEPQNPADYDYSAYQDDTDRADLLRQLSVLAARQQEAELEVAKAEAALSQAQAALLDISEQQIPELMARAEVKTYTTSFGLTVSVEEQLRCSVPKKNREAAFAWVEDNGGEKLVKRAIEILFGRDEDAWARKFLADCRRRKKQLNMGLTKKVEPSTLKKFLKDHLEEGTDVPMELFGAHHQRRAKVEVKK